MRRNSMCKVAKHKEHLGNLLQDGDEGTPNPHLLLQQRSLNALGQGEVGPRTSSASASGCSRTWGTAQGLWEEGGEAVRSEGTADNGPVTLPTHDPDTQGHGLRGMTD